jgi:hypothetical protein
MAWEREARRRFEELARENPNDALAPSFFLVALEHAQNANESDETLNALRLEYLTLFPNASNRGAFALDLARRFVDAEDYASAERALEGVAPDDPLFPYALEFERRIYNARAAQTPSESLFVDTTARAPAQDERRPFLAPRNSRRAKSSARGTMRRTPAQINLPPIRKSSRSSANLRLPTRRLKTTRSPTRSARFSTRGNKPFPTTRRSGKFVLIVFLWRSKRRRRKKSSRS